MKRTLIVLCAILIFSTLGVYLIWPKSLDLKQVDKEKALTDLLGRKVDLSTKSAAPDKVYEGQYSSFKYPGEAVVYEYRAIDTSSQSGQLENFSYDLRSPRIVFNYAAIERELGDITDEPSVRLRTLPERGYKQTPITLDGEKGILFGKNETPTSERSIFVLKNGVMYSFAVTGSDFKALDRVVASLISSFKFLPSQ